MKNNKMNLAERVLAPTPKWFKVLRSIGLALLAISGTVVAAPIVLPATVVAVAGYMAVAGGVISAVSQMTVDQDVLKVPDGNPIQVENTVQEIEDLARDGD